MKITLILMFLVLFLIVPLGFSQETITLSTYYPSPFGVYQRLVTNTLGVGDNNTAVSGIDSSDAPDPSVTAQQGDVWVAGDVGVGTRTPQNRLDVNGSAAIGSGYAGTNAAPTNGLIVEGDVGIGTPSPAVKLEVAGQVKFGAYTLPATDGNSGDCLITDGSGTVTWKACQAQTASTQFEGKHGPWDHVGGCGAAAPPLAASGLQEGSTVTASNVQGTWSFRIYHGIDYDPRACNSGTHGTFTSDSDHTNLGRHSMADFQNGVIVPAGASRLYFHVMDGCGNYFDNSGNRDSRAPCSVDLTIR
jgi:hypothetical protein